MIATVSGTVGGLTGEVAVVEVGGFGVAVLCSPNTLAGLRVGERAMLWTSLVVREDSLTLFGFATEAERVTFEMLQTATGVGPKLAQAILAALSPAEIRSAVLTEDHDALMRVSGVGRKGAQRLVIELAGKVGLLPHLPGVPDARPAPNQGSLQPSWNDAVRNALVSLGYSAREADDAVARVASDAASDEGVELDASSGLRRALSALAGA